MIIALLLLAQAAQPWKKDRIVGNSNGPALMLVNNFQSMTTISYKSMAACERARRYIVLPPAGSPAPGGAIYGAPAVTYTCVPR